MRHHFLVKDRKETKLNGGFLKEQNTTKFRMQNNVFLALKKAYRHYMIITLYKVVVSARNP